MQVTKHGDKRMRKRLGLKRKVVEKQAAMAYENGQNQNAFTVSFKKYLDLQAITHGSVIRVYKENMFFFNKGGVLITCWPVPAKFRKNIKDRANKP